MVNPYRKYLREITAASREVTKSYVHLEPAVVTDPAVGLNPPASNVNWEYIQELDDRIQEVLKEEIDDGFANSETM